MTDSPCTGGHVFTVLRDVSDYGGQVRCDCAARLLVLNFDHRLLQWRIRLVPEA